MDAEVILLVFDSLPHRPALLCHAALGEVRIVVTRGTHSTALFTAAHAMPTGSGNRSRIFPGRARIMSSNACRVLA